jgi:hypothetical protein
MTILWYIPESFGTRMSEKGRSSYRCLVSRRLNMKLRAEQKTPQQNEPTSVHHPKDLITFDGETLSVEE